MLKEHIKEQDRQRAVVFDRRKRRVEHLLKTAPERINQAAAFLRRPAPTKEDEDRRKQLALKYRHPEPRDPNVPARTPWQMLCFCRGQKPEGEEAKRQQAADMEDLWRWIDDSWSAERHAQVDPRVEAKDKTEVKKEEESKKDRHDRFWAEEAF